MSLRHGKHAALCSPASGLPQVPGRDWTDPKTNLTIRVPGSDLFVQQQSDPYGDIVDLAVDLDADGIDADYEVCRSICPPLQQRAVWPLNLL